MNINFNSSYWSVVVLVSLAILVIGLISASTSTPTSRQTSVLVKIKGENTLTYNKQLDTLADQTIDSCYYQTFNDTNSNSDAQVGDICNNSIGVINSLCQQLTEKLEACSNDQLKKYLRAMEG